MVTTLIHFIRTVSENLKVIELLLKIKAKREEENADSKNRCSVPYKLHSSKANGVTQHPENDKYSTTAECSLNYVSKKGKHKIKNMQKMLKTCQRQKTADVIRNYLVTVFTPS